MRVRDPTKRGCGTSEPSSQEPSRQAAKGASNGAPDPCQHPLRFPVSPVPVRSLSVTSPALPWMPRSPAGSAQSKQTAITDHDKIGSLVLSNRLGLHNAKTLYMLHILRRETRQVWIPRGIVGTSWIRAERHPPAYSPHGLGKPVTNMPESKVRNRGRRS